jgi:hypothetical protein
MLELLEGVLDAQEGRAGLRAVVHEVEPVARTEVAGAGILVGGEFHSGAFS